ncbi:29077_t:CDS:2 [Gigaspora margarita]|uniref:29077_t:CDS:1 n=1 Tax=Gigaspora margarita TaxID=4874 RepID=A0ABN7W5T0_GIGMA|nr:29077_t:CDS:2 [Gigaspora margarita]
MYRQACKLETIYEYSSDEEISTTFHSQLEINPIATTSSTNAFDGNRSTISSIKQRNITPKSSIFESNLEMTRVVESKRSAINPNLSLPLPHDTNYPGVELMTRSSPNLHNRPDLYSENDDKKTQSCSSVISFKVHIHWIYPSTPLVTKLYRSISLQEFKKSVAKSCAIDIPNDCVIIWHRNLNCDGISVGEENNDKVILRYLIKSGKVSEIKTEATWDEFRSFWSDDVEVSFVKKELLE